MRNSKTRGTSPPGVPAPRLCSPHTANTLLIEVLAQLGRLDLLSFDARLQLDQERRQRQRQEWRDEPDQNPQP